MPALHGLADRPVLLVDQVPQVAGVRRVERRVGDRGGVEQQQALDPGVVDRLRQQHERRDVVRRRRQHQVRVHQLALVPGPLRLVEAGQRSPGRSCRVIVKVHAPSRCGTPLSQSMPVPATAEGRHQPGELGVDRAAVVALVVVLGDHLVVGGDLVAEPQTGDQLAHRVVREGARRPRHRLGQGRRRRAEVDEDEARPVAGRDRVQREGRPVRRRPGRRAAPAAASRPARRSTSGTGSAASPPRRTPAPRPAAPGTAASRGAGRRCTPRAGGPPRRW